MFPAVAGTNNGFTKHYNRRVVLEVIRRHGLISRTEIAREADITLKAISAIVSELEEEGWIRTPGRRSVARGQPPVEYELNPDGMYAIGAALDLDGITVALVDICGKVRDCRRVETELVQPERAVELIAELVRPWLGEPRRAAPSRLLGLGVALNGTPDTHNERVVSIPSIPGWEGFPLRARLEAVLHTAVFTANDAVAAAMGETWFGAGRKAQSLFYVLFAHGMNGSLIEAGHPFRGVWGVSGKLGHVPVVPDGPTCPGCGGRGCLGLYASLQSFNETIGRSRIDEDYLMALFDDRDPRLTAWFEGAARHLTTALLAVENLLNPEVIALGGRMPQPMRLHLVDRLGKLLPPLRSKLKPSHPQLLVATAPEPAIAVGAATLPLYMTVAPAPELVFWSLGREEALSSA